MIALWLGHEAVTTTNIYLHADMSQKERAIARTAPPNTTLAGIAPRIRSWPSSRVCDYADNIRHPTPQ